MVLNGREENVLGELFAKLCGESGVRRLYERFNVEMENGFVTRIASAALPPATSKLQPSARRVISGDTLC
jgi:hypothetical protein